MNLPSTRRLVLPDFDGETVEMTRPHEEALPALPTPAAMEPMSCRRSSLAPAPGRWASWSWRSLTHQW